ncbi:phosphoribosylanthranilate isomerase [Clostridium saccharoperbutylacetonicum]|uniref:N-(5'-phosphoribosyl)anthranilate isomerase n=1 Tax=Clostridium saccharoperbutylacetonicum N1-4(HMT) TaxID=931276 RepID=M1MFY0_9CLOT|nr:phosphoribosylanthranilate isomerase [Clostridium saccharoperbutylacetonicum]AGF56814.1 N-(5'-phosphoribosyl)anthranilate isomerase TrpF [Clostridium saccharoperbutylacetonicum N1-4(HMT)]NRT62429.1 phosphoribosylanthranilate isomerase [Clostridium saccharoperbutylacetonicum]NSB25770.1 phosphoribosylanthranilate isomerase [Clostridium saccharoperbutylacetonicum]NSB45135.1 phosphoribosylanthranilate isomerase [Clostridium saccharoperbutylacetonicum]
MIKIKICGITNETEIEYLNILKPDYVGFLFTKSKRQIDVNKAKILINLLNKDIKTVGVFKDNPIDEILKVIKEINLNAIQLHGEENENYISSLKGSLNKQIEIWKALSINNIEEIENYNLKNNNREDKLVDNFLIDGSNPGSGETFSLEKIKNYFGKQSLKNTNNKKNNFILAGGLSPENIVERIEKANPIGIDVSSGVEIVDDNEKQTKSFDKMKDLIEKVRALND